jgi:hemerythrin-like domain-containing protein
LSDISSIRCNQRRIGGKEGFVQAESRLVRDANNLVGTALNRRGFLVASTVLGFSGMVAGTTPLALGGDAKSKEAAKEEAKPPAGAESPVSATEDLMREHGVLDRILLIYEEGIRRIRAKEEVPVEVLRTCVTMVVKFVENYHEKLEENFIFPEFEKRNQQVALVKTLRAQHTAGRQVTEDIVYSLLPDRTGKLAPLAPERLAQACEAFIHLYRPHKAREDTVLFPALHFLLTEQQMNKLGDQFEEEEDRLFGEQGFEKTVGGVAEIEKQLNINDLDQFIPKTVAGKS